MTVAWRLHDVMQTSCKIHATGGGGSSRRGSWGKGASRPLGFWEKGKLFKIISQNYFSIMWFWNSPKRFLMFVSKMLFQNVSELFLESNFLKRWFDILKSKNIQISRNESYPGAVKIFSSAMQLWCGCNQTRQSPNGRGVFATIPSCFLSCPRMWHQILQSPIALICLLASLQLQ